MLFGGFWTILSLVAAVRAVADPPLHLTIRTPDELYDATALVATVRLKNVGNRTLRLLNDPYSVLTPHWETNIWDIRNGHGGVPEFNGVQVKWSPALAAAAQQYTVLVPGESRTYTHKLGEKMYNFSRLGAPRTYTVLLGGSSRSFIHVPDNGVGDKLNLETVTSKVEVLGTPSTIILGRTVPPVNTLRSPRLSKRINTFQSCNADQVVNISRAVFVAQQLVNESYHYLTFHATNCSYPRYETWFGSWTKQRADTVTSHYNHIRNGQLFSDTYNCSCDDPGIYAYVYPTEFGTIYLCSAFWSAPIQGTDSKAGTLIHESSHFIDNGGTQDFVYGQDGCKALAIQNPLNATNNADSHEYFAENNPYLN
ncbi:uncharacterized protein EI90DRAFT_2470387 [Cantharellus anzutake]|uniref:uncharacterized protein n=1 Tax=Cantharellus anzutake TaxID=1750568 RepID=UPI001904F0C4|nr:uncharacterized protein EI90DRAFT_2470387 [Cantharellus anzutake]KAF8339203.1 hypothetical protein EI90DRAFT_2470387 [Cantharellus anzutake]